MSAGELVGCATVRPARHDLLRVNAEDWPAVAAMRLPQPSLLSYQLAMIERWGEGGWPVIARRSMPCDEPNVIPVGLPLPPHLGKARVALAIPSGVFWWHMQGVSLADVLDSLPLTWREPVDAVLSLARSLGITPRVFGALLWQALTGMRYLRPASDLDLLWPLDDIKALDPLLDGLEQIEAAWPIRIDGEVLTAQGEINWRELAGARRIKGEIVIAKSIHWAGFVPASSIVAREAASCC